MSRFKPIIINPLKTNMFKFFYNNKANTHIKINFLPNLRINNLHISRLSTVTKAATFQGQPIRSINLKEKVLNDDQISHIPFEVTPVSKKTKLSTEETNSSNLKKLIAPYVTLTKPNLTFLVMLSSVCTYALSPYSATIPELMFLTIGTSLASGAANAINMGREPDFDKLMKRTSARPIVRGQVTPLQAYKFAGIIGSVGIAMLYFGVNSTVALLGLSNIVLYSWVYTSLKRKSIINTWVGALVGAIPPLMGWAASSPLTHPACWCLAGLLYAWQFPHFNAISHNIRTEYKNAGYVMTAAENPKLNARVALRYSLLMFPLCYGLTYFDVTDWVFPFDSAILNGWLTYWAFKFWWQQNRNYANGANPGPNSKGIQLANIYAKKMFWGSVWHLPGVLVLAMLHKKGQWDRLLSWVDGKKKLN